MLPDLFNDVKKLTDLKWLMLVIKSGILLLQTSVLQSAILNISA